MISERLGENYTNDNFKKVNVADTQGTYSIVTSMDTL